MKRIPSDPAGSSLVPKTGGLSMKKWLSILLAALLLLPVFSCDLLTEEEEEPQPELPIVRVGVFEPQSGENGRPGRQEALGMQYANRMAPTVDIAGTTYRVELVYADNASSKKLAPRAAESLLSNGISIALGSFDSDLCLAAGDVFSRAGMPVIGVTCTNPAVTATCDAYFRICFSDPFQGSVLAGFARDSLDASRAYCLVKQGGEYSTGLVDSFRLSFGEDRCVVASYAEETEDFTPYLREAAAAGCDVLFAPTYAESGAKLIACAAKEGLSMPILAGDTWDSSILLDAAKGTGLEIYLSSFYQEGADEIFDRALRRWIRSDPAARSNNGGSLEIAAATVMGYDAYHVALEAMRKAGSTAPSEILKALPDVAWDGVTGRISFNAVGDVKRSGAFIKRCDTAAGKWAYVTKANAILPG